jgi:hypothetical protein
MNVHNIVVGVRLRLRVVTPELGEVVVLRIQLREITQERTGKLVAVIGNEGFAVDGEVDWRLLARGRVCCSGGHSGASFGRDAVCCGELPVN